MTNLFIMHKAAFLAVAVVWLLALVGLVAKEGAVRDLRKRTVVNSCSIGVSLVVATLYLLALMVPLWTITHAVVTR